MISISPPVESIEVRRDLERGPWIVTCGAERFEVREWTWGERARLLEACAHGGNFDRNLFVDGLLELVVTPAPGRELRPLLALVVLQLFGVRESSPRVGLTRMEDALMRRFGWMPSRFDGEQACALDRLAAEILGDASAAAQGASTWNRIVVKGDG